MPTRRQLESLMGGGYDDFPGYAPPGRSRSLLDLTMEQGRIGAENAYQQGNIWSQALMSAGQQIAGGLQAHQEQKALKKRDAAWLSTLEDPEFWKDPRAAYQRSVSIWGPEKGPEQFKAALGVQQLMQPKRDPKADREAAAYAIRGMKGMDPTARAAAWPKIAPKFNEAIGVDAAPAAYDDKFFNESALGFADQILGGPKLEKVTTRNADGSEVTQFVDPAAGGKYESAPEQKKHMVTTTGPGGGPMQRLATEAELAAGVPAYRAPREPKDETLVPIIGPDGEPVLVPRSQAAGKRPASSREQARPVTSGDANRLADFDTSLDDLAALKSQIGGATGVRAKVGAALPNVITEMTGIGAEAKSKQATIDRVKQVIGKTLEGGVLRKEDERKYEKILPTIGDPPQVVEAKLRGLEQAIQLRRQTLVESLSDAGYETGRYGAREKGPARPKSKAEFDALSPGTPFIAPDGSRRIK